MRTCNKCGETKPDEEMTSNGKKGVVSWCKVCRSIHDHDVYVKNRCRVLERTRKWQKKYTEKRKVDMHTWYLRNKSSVLASTAKRKAAKLLRTPVWSDLEKIRKIYLNCPSGYHVDHIIPLQGRLVSGLHVPENLQYLTAFENCSKNNRFDPIEQVA
tara:strand:+ start:167 stop:637 length:471 start_codon:yes stop_codon:yes gene_type:complete